jgi:hypothetical protein
MTVAAWPRYNHDTRGYVLDNRGRGGSKFQLQSILPEP